MKSAVLAFFAIGAAALSSAQADSINITGPLNGLTTVANGLPSNLTPINGLSTSDPVANTGSTATSTYNFSPSSFIIDVNHVRTGAPGSQAASSGAILFDVLADAGGPLNYTLSGSYSVTDTSPTHPGEVNLVGTLSDLTLLATVVDQQYFTNNAPNQSFTLGQPGGLPTNVGPLSGLLIAGHSYEFDYIASIDNTSADAGASATGNITLDFTAAPVPLPAAAWSGMGLIAALAAFSASRRFIKRRPLEKFLDQRC